MLKGPSVTGRRAGTRHRGRHLGARTTWNRRRVDAWAASGGPESRLGTGPAVTAATNAGPEVGGGMVGEVEEQRPIAGMPPEDTLSGGLAGATATMSAEYEELTHLP